MERESDIVEGYGRCKVIVTERILMADNGRPVEGACVYEVGSEAYNISNQFSEFIPQ